MLQTEDNKRKSFSRRASAPSRLCVKKIEINDQHPPDTCTKHEKIALLSLPISIIINHDQKKTAG